jgi:hypothetical protein
MKKIIMAFSVIVGCFGNSHAQMIVNDPINGAIEKVLDMLNPKLTQQIQQVKRAKEQLREQVAITTATETNANAEMATIDYSSNASKFSANFAIQGLKMKDKEDKNIALYNTGIALIGKISSQNPNHIAYYSKLYTEIKNAMASYGKQADLLGYKTGGSTTNIDNVFSGSQGGLVNTGNSSTEEQAFVDAKNKADALANQYKEDVGSVNKTYQTVLDKLNNPPSGGWLGNLFNGIWNIGTLGLTNELKDKIAEKGKSALEDWYSSQTKTLDNNFNSGMGDLGFGDLLSVSSGALGSQLGAGKAVKIDPKNGFMDDAGKIMLGYNIVEKYDDISNILIANNNAISALIGENLYNQTVSQLTNGQSKYSWKTKQESLIAPKQSTTGFY